MLGCRGSALHVLARRAVQIVVETKAAVPRVLHRLEVDGFLALTLHTAD